MKTGFDIIKGRNTNEAISITDLEVKYNFQLPPIFKFFAENFQLGEENIFIEKYKLSNSNIPFPLDSYNFYHNDENIGFSHFIEIEKSFEVYNSNGLSDLDYENKFFPIASADGNGLSVGTEGIYIDKIIWDKANAEFPQIIANNVFEFIRGIEVSWVEESCLYGNILYSQLHKKFGEIFWLVK